MHDSEAGKDTLFPSFLTGLVVHFVDEKAENQKGQVTHTELFFTMVKYT